MGARLLLQVLALRRPHRRQPNGHPPSAGYRKRCTEVYTAGEADLILAWAGDQPGKRGRVGYVAWPPCATQAHRGGRDGALQQGAGVVAQALDNLGAEYVLLVETVEQAHVANPPLLSR